MQCDGDKISRSGQNDLMIGSDIVILRVNNIGDNVILINNNFIKQCRAMRNKIKEIESLCQNTDQNICMAACIEF